jgi:hypothetical protein
METSASVLMPSVRAVPEDLRCHCASEPFAYIPRLHLCCLRAVYILLCCLLQVNVHNSRAMCLCCRAHFIVSSSTDNLADNPARRSGSLKPTNLSALGCDTPTVTLTPCDIKQVPITKVSDGRKGHRGIKPSRASRTQFKLNCLRPAGCGRHVLVTLSILSAAAPTCRVQQGQTRRLGDHSHEMRMAFKRYRGSSRGGLILAMCASCCHFSENLLSPFLARRRFADGTLKRYYGTINRTARGLWYDDTSRYRSHLVLMYQVSTTSGMPMMITVAPKTGSRRVSHNHRAPLPFDAHLIQSLIRGESPHRFLPDL